MLAQPDDTIKLTRAELPNVLAKRHWPGACIATRGRGLVVRPVIQLSQWLGMRALPAEDGGPLPWGDAWQAARWRHIGALSLGYSGMYEMTNPKSQCRHFSVTTEREFMVCDWGTEYVSMEVAQEMARIARARIPYPNRELVANTVLLSKWLAKIMGHQKFAQTFCRDDASVCGGTLVEAARASDASFFPGPVESWSPARIVQAGDWARRTLYVITD